MTDDLPDRVLSYDCCSRGFLQADKRRQLYSNGRTRIKCLRPQRWGLADLSREYLLSGNKHGYIQANAGTSVSRWGRLRQARRRVSSRKGRDSSAGSGRCGCFRGVEAVKPVTTPREMKNCHRLQADVQRSCAARFVLLCVHCRHDGTDTRKPPAA